MKIGSKIALGAVFALITMLQPAAASTYNFVSGVAGGGVKGTIETDGTIGTLTGGNIVNWNLILNDGTNTFTLIGNGSAGDNSDVALFSATGFTATSTSLVADFNDSGFLLFQSPFIGSGKSFLCLALNTNCGVAKNSVNFLTNADLGSIVKTAQSGSVVFATSSVSAVPLPAALPLLAAGLGLLGGMGWIRGRKAA